MRNQQIKKVDSYKHLGVILKNMTLTENLRTIHKSFIRPLLEYADVV